ncbi:MAG: methyltransferase domain-containing protein [Magnetococcus sp. YQC-5]
MEPVAPLEPLSYGCMDPRRVRRALRRGAPVKPDDLLASIDTMLAERLSEILLTPTRILELSRYPGHGANLLQHQHPKANIIAMGLVPPTNHNKAPWRLPWHRRPSIVTGDPIHLPFPRHHFDLVLANMILHWMVDPMAALREMRRVLKPGGILLLATMGAGTLGELKTTLAQTDQHHYGRTWIRVPEFTTLLGLGDMLTATGFVRSVADRDFMRPMLPDTATLLAELRRMGAGNPHRQRPPGLMGKGYPKLLATTYQHLFGQANGSIPVTLEILFGHAWKADPSQEKPRAKTNEIPS